MNEFYKYKNYFQLIYTKVKKIIVFSIKYNIKLYKHYINWKTFDVINKHPLSGFFVPKEDILNTVGIMFQKKGYAREKAKPIKVFSIRYI